MAQAEPSQDDSVDLVERAVTIIETADETPNRDAIEDLVKGFTNLPTPDEEIPHHVAKKRLVGKDYDSKEAEAAVDEALDGDSTFNVGRGGGGGGESDVRAPIVEISPGGEYDEDGMMVTVKARVNHLFGPDALLEEMEQAGVLADESDAEITFSRYPGVDGPLFEEQGFYRIHNARVQGYTTDDDERQLELVLGEQADVEAVGESGHLTGWIVGFRPGSGLIERCPEPDCSRRVPDRECHDHGEVDSVQEDLRVKAWFDTGIQLITIYIYEELIERMTGIDLETAIDIARETEGENPVSKQLEQDLGGQYYHIHGGFRPNSDFRTDNLEAADTPSVAEYEELEDEFAAVDDEDLEINWE